jgi:hypothetical protein
MVISSAIRRVIAVVLPAIGLVITLAAGLRPFMGPRIMAGFSGPRTILHSQEPA